MRCEQWSQVIHVGQYVEHASREDILRELSQHQRGDRRRRRGLENEAVAKQQGRSEFERGQQQREVPGRDTADHAKSLAVHLDAMGFIVLNDFNRNVDGCEIADQTFEIGRASCRERVCKYVYISVFAVSLKKKKQ